jgi:hypothetical protein
MSPLIQLLEQITKQQYEIKALADNQVKFQPDTSECYVTLPNGLAKKCTNFHTYKLKEDRSYRVVLKNMYHTINCKEIKISGILNNNPLNVLCRTETCPE